MNVALLTIGDELLIGQVVNTNASWISARVTEIGGTVVTHVTCADDATVMLAELDRLSAVADVLLLTGGLGPTHDDITKDVLASWYDDHLVEHAPTVERLTTFMALRGRTLSERNRAQAMLPSTCTVLDNPLGTAPGMLFERNDRIVVSMPGVPAEMRDLMTTSVLPRLARWMETHPAASRSYRTLHTTGVPEATLADMIGDVSVVLGTSTLAFLPNAAGVRLRLGALAVTAAEREAELDRLEDFLRSRIGRHVVGTGDMTLAHATGDRLLRAGATLAVAESCTGGMLGASCTDVAGSSRWFMGGVISYDNAVKMNLLGVTADDLAAHGAVSEVVARQMASGVRSLLHTSYGIGITGIAGPDGGTPEKPVGTVWIGIATPTTVEARRFLFGTDRTMNRQRAVAAALAMVMEAV